MLDNFQEKLVHFNYLDISDIQFLKEIVNLNSRSMNSIGVNKVQNLLKSKYESLNFTTKMIPNLSHESGDLLIAEFYGSSDFIVTGIGHADTVLFPTKNHQFSISTLTNTITGPGIADNKSGLLIALKGFEYFLKKYPAPKLSLRFVSSPNEEVGSPGFHETFNQLGKESMINLGFEPSLPDGAIIESRNGNRWYELSVKGEAYHSGRAPKGHMNSAHDLCRIIANFDEAFSDHEDIFMNIGQIEGGHSFNTICDEVKAKIDTRFSSFHGLEKIIDIIENISPENQKNCSKNKVKTSLSLKIADFCPPMEYNQVMSNELEIYKQIISDSEGKSIKSVHCGGAADINHFSVKEGIAFDGLGAIGGNMHRKDEYIEIQSLETRAISFGEYLCSIEARLTEKV